MVVYFLSFDPKDSYPVSLQPNVFMLSIEQPKFLVSYIPVFQSKGCKQGENLLHPTRYCNPLVFRKVLYIFTFRRYLICTLISISTLIMTFFI